MIDICLRKIGNLDKVIFFYSDRATQFNDNTGKEREFQGIVHNAKIIHRMVQQNRVPMDKSFKNNKTSYTATEPVLHRMK